MIPLKIINRKTPQGHYVPAELFDLVWYAGFLRVVNTFQKDKSKIRKANKVVSLEYVWKLFFIRILINCYIKFRNEFHFP